MPQKDQQVDDDVAEFEKFKQERQAERDRAAAAEAKKAVLIQAALKTHPTTMSQEEMDAQGFPLGHRYNPVPAEHET